MFLENVWSRTPKNDEFWDFGPDGIPLMKSPLPSSHPRQHTCGTRATGLPRLGWPCSVQGGLRWHAVHTSSGAWSAQALGALARDRHCAARCVHVAARRGAHADCSRAQEQQVSHEPAVCLTPPLPPTSSSPPTTTPLPSSKQEERKRGSHSGLARPARWTMNLQF
jgi:hypothetical protein